MSMAQQATIKHGYKQTELGVIPDDWVVQSVQELIENRAINCHIDGNHGELYPRSNEFTKLGVPYIAANDFRDGAVNFDQCKKLSAERAKKFRKGIAINGDVLFAHNATVGPVAIIETGLDYVILSTTATCFRCDNRYLFNKYLRYFFESEFFVKQYSAVMSQSTRNQVPITAQRKFHVIIPAFPEQTAIANILSDTDALIEHLEKLIAKKKAIKQGAMQQLLTGKKRLPGFSGEWGEKKLSVIADLFKGRGLSKSEIVDDGKYSCILYGELFTTYSQVIEDVKSKTNTREGLPSINGDILLPGSTTTVGIDLATASSLQKNDVLMGGDIIVIRKKGLKLYDSEFLANHLTHIAKYKIAEITQGITIIHLHGSRLKELIVKIPNDVSEQTAIATVLSAMDAEIESLKQKKAKYSLLKQGMMQQLLTGKIRVYDNN